MSEQSNGKKTLNGLLTFTNKKAIISIARMMLTCIYQMLCKNETFNPIDRDYLDMPEHLQEKYQKQAVEQAIYILQKQGFTITKDDVIYAI